MVGLAGCGGANTPTMAPLPAPVTRATLSGPLCGGSETHCRCRDDGEVVPVTDDAARKRYEIRIGPAPNPLWVTVDDMVLYKSRERGVECFYVELLPGEHPITVRAEGEPGFVARVSISEQSAKGWYDTFLFDCGAPGNCAMLDLEDWLDGLSRYPRGVHDPCGSTKIGKVRYVTGRVPDQRHPDALELSLVLDSYRFKPTLAPGAAGCRDKF